MRSSQAALDKQKTIDKIPISQNFLEDISTRINSYHQSCLEKKVRDVFACCDILVNMPVDISITVNDDKFYKKILSGGSKGLGESYMEGQWDCENLDQFFAMLLSQKNLLPKLIGPSSHSIFNYLVNVPKCLPYNIGEAHYDLGNDFYRSMLGRTMTYSCGYWRDAADLDTAQKNKMDLICRKLGLKKGQRILDIGCGWGQLLKHAVREYSVSAVGITVSRQQYIFASRSVYGMPVQIRLQDYHELDRKEKFDHILSVGMFEHVGHRNYREFMAIVANLLKDEGLFLLQTIGTLKKAGSCDAWLMKYIFPHAALPSAGQICDSMSKFFMMEDWHNFGADYDRTLMAWHNNFENNWDNFRERYGDRFYRMWRYYLLCCAAAFRNRNVQLWQIVMSKQGVAGGYKSVR